MSTKDGKLIWVDLEMTGLNPDMDKIVEIATIITDANLNVLAEGPDFVIYQPPEIINNMIAWNKEHFASSGLLNEIHDSKISLAKAEEQTLDFLKKHCHPKTALLAGNSVHIDREFIRIHMPKILDFVHYRIVDVTTVKELSLRWYPEIPPFQKEKAHRAHDDILESIDELKYYQARIFA